MENKFSIKAKTYTIKHNQTSEKDVILNSSIKYIIPVYQRPYSWNEEQIDKFISDIFRSFYGFDRNSEPEPMFIGTMQLSGQRKLENGSIIQEVVDGQQRLTTLFIFLKILSQKFSQNKELNQLDFDWLETKVNSGEQQKNLSHFLNLNSLPEASTNNLNPYITNALIINNLIEGGIKNDEGNRNDFDIDGFVNHLYSNVYFVVIETVAGLSKTLQIFDAINTTGLDLNGSDVFKIRMYEYLKDKKKQEETAFDKINNLYAKVDNYNRVNEINISFTEILSIYQDILISRYNLPNVLFSLGTTTFFDRLFDSLFNLYQWENFTKINEVELILTDIDRVIEARFQWENLLYPTLEDASLMSFVWWSRYSRFWKIVIIFLYRFNENPNDVFRFINKLSKLFILYSIYFDKAINNIYTFTYKLIDDLIVDEKPLNDLIKRLEDKISGLVPYHDINGKEVFLSKLNGNIVYNAKKKNLICRLSALLEEDLNSDIDINERRERLFHSQKFPNDIEHIQSFNDENIDERESIKNKWGENLHSIGNLVLLERNINRKISNKSYGEKVKEYSTSYFKCVKGLNSKYPEWGLEQALARKETEIRKIENYLFS
ncbi:DUF262 domain-containing protein [Lacinutrix sp. MedPE-SW]|uniref:DUF262 domain-containing protein n=1 Tax=Lacinutrix sp. MedPE-SW TaxID=1860087 RepID=UPI0009164E3D|nr:DUF262 domain-containing HNH endonuclease family protein [Lacinutrix sp. MedPE-SW]OIQ21192.1 MAG: hypothetical protein BM549_09460 [Lacinutrix sp. MedPE-SW]